MFIAGCILYSAHAQEARPVTVKEFIEIVLDHPDIQASEDKIRDSEYDLQLARLSPAPSLTVGNVSGDISGINMPQQYYLGIDYTVEPGGKRKHRIAYAKAGKDLLIAEHNVFVDQFLRQALLTYQKCWMMEQQSREIAEFDNLIPGNEGLKDSIPLEMLRIHHSLRRLEFDTEYSRVLSDFRSLTEHRFEDAPVKPSEPVWDNRAQLTEIDVQENAPALQLARAEQKLKHEEVELRAADMIGDVSFAIGNNFISEATNPESPSPQYNAITATVTIPLQLNLRTRPRKTSLVATNKDSDEEQELLQGIRKRYAAVQKENQRLSAQLRQIETLISLELTQIKKCVDGNSLVEEVRKLESLQQMRWEKMMQMAVNNSIIHGTQYQWNGQQVTSAY